MGTTAARQVRAARAAAPSAPETGESAQAPTKLSSAIAAVLVAATATVLLAMGVRTFLPTATTSHGEAALLAWVLTSAALLGALLSAYLVLVWSIAALALALGPASRAGRALVLTLRVVAPQLARRVTLSAAIASTATGLVLAPATAATLEQAPAATVDAATLEDAPAATVGAASARLGSPSPAAPQPAEATERAGESNQAEAPVDQPGASTGASGTGELPALGWGQSPSAAESPSPAQDPSVDSVDDTPSHEEDLPPEATVVIVQPGDSLWSITDDLLGPDTDPPEVIASTWPVLYEANRDLIGADPNRITPGQELTVPSLPSIQEQS